MNAPQKLKTKRCKQCGDPFIQYNSLRPVCAKFDCQVSYAEAHVKRSVAVRERQERVKTREAKLRIKPLSKWLDEAQVSINRWVREVRDVHLPCISCGRFAISYDAGHYRSRGAASHLRFHEDNINKQCARPCNHDLSGNIVEYRKGLLAKIGVERLEALENDNANRKWTVDDAKAIKQKYNELWRNRNDK